MNSYHPPGNNYVGQTHRSAGMVMDLKRLGASFPTRLSFIRRLIRRIMQEKWSITRISFDLDDNGFGQAIYQLEIDDKVYSFVVFADYLDPEQRSDRVIAEKWDMTATLCEGPVSDTQLQSLKENVPLQEKGRVSSNCLVLTRANKSQRNFEYVVGKLAQGQQPSSRSMADVGYLYRTTAVYGSGKFGMADWQKVSHIYKTFASPFAAEMFTCFLIREFSLDQAEHLARRRNPVTAIHLDPALKRYIGIGNATGLGMAPYLINHPLLIENWINIRETALNAVLNQSMPDANGLHNLLALCRKARQHFAEATIDDEIQTRKNSTLLDHLQELITELENGTLKLSNWSDILELASDRWSLETQEILVSILIEIHADLVDDLPQVTTVDEHYPLRPAMRLTELRSRIEQKYDWALRYDFSKDDEYALFWYRSVEKMEPRLGVRKTEPGSDRETPLGIAHAVQSSFKALSSFMETNQDGLVGEFVLAHPEHRAIIRRIQTMSETTYGEIRANLYHADTLPLNLLRCKLSFFGVGKFSPRSRFWVRNIMFQGAPIIADIGQDFQDDWCFPLAPIEADAPA